MSLSKKSKKHTKKLTQEQRQFVEYLSNPDNSESPEAFAARIDVKVETLSRWKADPHIVQSAFQICVVRLGAEIPKALNMLLQKALKDKDVAACKLFFQQLDNKMEAPETELTVDDVLLLINKVVKQFELNISDQDKHGKHNDTE